MYWVGGGGDWEMEELTVPRYVSPSTEEELGFGAIT